MNKSKLILISALVGIVLLLSIVGIGTDSTTTPTQDVQKEARSATEVAPAQNPIVQTDTSSQNKIESLYPVVSVVDGDTLKVSINGAIETIRLIGINTPETVDPRKPVECFGKEASTKAKSVLTGKNVLIETDVSQGERDKYDRLLAYVFLENGTNFNKMMISEGYAYEYTYNAPYKYQSEFKTAEANARNNKIGLWADGVCDTPTTTSVPAQTTQSSTAYICSYNAYNCTDFKTHNEAQKVFEECGGTSNDIHRLDQDKDGLACETLP